MLYQPFNFFLRMLNMFSANDFLSIQIHGGSGGVAAVMESFLTFIESLHDKNPEQIFVTIMPGFAAMANVHPLLVHFPIALLTTFFLLDVFGSLFGRDAWRQAASYLLYLGAIAALLTVMAGLQAAATVPHDEVVHQIMERHEAFGFSIASIAVFLSLWRLMSREFPRGGGNFLFLILAALLNLLIVLGADLGGLMVYKHGVAVAAVPEPVETVGHDHGHSHQHNHSHQH